MKEGEPREADNQDQEEFDSATAEQNRRMYLKDRDTRRENATEMQRNIAEVQAAKFESTLYDLMRRSDNNPDLINNLNGFLDALGHQARFGQSDKPIIPAREKDLVKYLGEKAEELRWDVGGGNRPTHRKPTWQSGNQ